MKKYKVSLCAKQYVYMDLEVEAENEKEAERLAIEDELYEYAFWDVDDTVDIEIDGPTREVIDE